MAEISTLQTINIPPDSASPTAKPSNAKEKSRTLNLDTSQDESRTLNLDTSQDDLEVISLPSYDSDAGRHGVAPNNWPTTQNGGQNGQNDLISAVGPRPKRSTPSSRNRQQSSNPGSAASTPHSQQRVLPDKENKQERSLSKLSRNSSFDSTNTAPIRTGDEQKPQISEANHAESKTKTNTQSSNATRTWAEKPPAHGHSQDVKSAVSFSLPSDLKSFLTSPVPRGVTIKAYIVRKKNLLSGSVYEMFVEDGDRFLMTSQRRPANKTANYLLSMDKSNTDKKAPGILGKLRGNKTGTEFVVYDAGINPNKPHLDRSVAPRRELAACIYTLQPSNIGPRDIAVFLPPIAESGEVTVLRPNSGDASILDKCKDKPSDFIVLRNLKPKFNKATSEYELNFYGRATVSSVKNFILTPDKEESKALLFGRDQSRFNVDIAYPLSPVQAFALCLTAFESKVATS